MRDFAAKFRHPLWGWVSSALATFLATLAPELIRALCLATAAIIAAVTFRKTDFGRNNRKLLIPAALAFALTAFGLFYAARSWDRRLDSKDKLPSAKEIAGEVTKLLPMPEQLATGRKPPEVRTGIAMNATADVMRGTMKTQRPLIREQLNRFIDEGENIKAQCMDEGESDSALYSRTQKWADTVVRFLDRYMGDEYKRRFTAATGTAAIPVIMPKSRVKRDVWKSADAKVDILERFLKLVSD